MSKFLLQLSDLHLRETDSQNVSSLNVDKFFEFTNEKCYRNVEEIFILFTGDLTQNGFEKEFILFEKFLSKIVAYFKAKYIKDPKILIVPGNHDLNLSNSEINFDEIINLEKLGRFADISNLASFEIVKMRHFLNRFGSNFKDDYFIANVKYDNLNFLLFNSSPFSSKEKRDKEHHFIPKESFDNLDYESFINSYNFALIHHRPDWFETNSATTLNSILNDKINICFCGHEHTENIMFNKTYNDYIFLNSGELIIKNKTLYGSANVVLLENNGEAHIRGYAYNRGDVSYSPIFQEQTINMKSKQSNGFCQHFKDTFVVKIEEKSIDLMNIFEMPYLYSATKNDGDIDDFDELVDFLLKGNKVFVYGRSNSGKTILLNRTVKEFETKHVILHISSDEVTNNFESVIENSYIKVYGKQKNFSDILNICPIVFVDGIDLIDIETKRNKFIDFLWNNFDNFMLTSSIKQKEFNNDKIKSIPGYMIHGFSLKQRNSFINKICSCFKSLTEEDAEKIKNAVSISFASCSMLDLSSPYFVLEITNKIIVDQLYKQQNVSDAFSLVFINEINNRIISFGRKEYLEDYLNVLSEIAFNVCQSQKVVVFDFDLISQSIKKCKEDYKNIKLSNDEFLKTFLQSGLIIKQDNDTYKICHNSILAYLASRKVCIEYKDGNVDVISNLYKNVEIGLNGDILLFVLYQLKETSVLFKIKDLLCDALKCYEEINLNLRNNPILRMKKDYEPETKEQAENKKEFIDRLDSAEKKEIREIEKKEQKALKNSDEEDVFIKTIQRAFKLTEILGKAVAGFKTELKHNKRLELATCALGSLLKIFYAIFDVSEKDAEEFHNIFEEYKEEKERIAKKEGKNEKEIQSLLSGFSFENFVYDVMTTNLLNDMSYLAKIMISNVSFEVIKQLNSDDNYFCYKLFQLIAFQQSGVMQSNFIKCLEDINNHEQNFYGNQVLSRRVVRVFTITNMIKSNELNKLAEISGIKKQRLFLYSLKSSNEKIK